jgi:hypothetical protein
VKGVAHLQRYVCFTVLGLFSVLFAFAVSPSPYASSLPGPFPPQEYADSDAALIEALDDCIQQRFLDIDKGFGFRRLVRPGETAHRFKPENAKELAVVSYLTGQKLEVVLYLAGRGIVAPNLNSKDVDNVAGKLIKGPIRITPSDKPVANLPTLRQLWDRGQEAMRVFQGSENYDFNLGEWKFIARPVRASDQSCLKCHQAGGPSYPIRLQGSTALQIGEPLGLLVYGYKKNDQ